MKVFVSWSGEFSKTAAESLRKLLPCMMQGLEVFVSKHDLESGGRWGPQLAAELETSSFGIICLTAENQAAPWIAFEAGALTKLAEGRACGLLLDGLTPANVSGPLAQFQHRRMVEEEFFLLFRDINLRLPSPLNDDQLRMVFNKWWPDLDAEYKAQLAGKSKITKKSITRDDRELLEEILERVRVLPSGRTSGMPALQDMVNANRALTRIIAARPQPDIDLLLEINRLKNAQDQEAVETLAVAEADSVARMISAGLLWRDARGKLVMSKFVGDSILPDLEKSQADRRSV